MGCQTAETKYVKFVSKISNWIKSDMEIERWDRRAKYWVTDRQTASGWCKAFEIC